MKSAGVVCKAALSAAVVSASFLFVAPDSAFANGNSCKAFGKNLFYKLRSALKGAVAKGALNFGLDLDMWATVIARDGRVCAVARSGDDAGAQWPGSRVISAQKANTANSFSLPESARNGFPLSTANLYSATQPGGSLFGLQFSNPVDATVVYDGAAVKYGTPGDPLVNKRPGGVNVFGGGLALYDAGNELLGAVGVSGDTSCSDHYIAWRVRDALGLDYVPQGVGTPGDNIIYDIENGESPSGFGHPTCLGNTNQDSTRQANFVAGQCPLNDGPSPECVEDSKVAQN